MLLPNAGKEWYNGVEVITLLKVFLVEDECVVREGLRDCIDWERYGFEFCGDAPDGELALPQIRKLRPDILITDIKMPVMNGLELAKACRERYTENCPYFIILTSYEDFQMARDALSYQVSDYLVKLELTPEVLKKAIDKIGRAHV